MAEDTEATRQVRRLQSELARVERERDDAYDKIRIAGEKARELRADVGVYRDQVEALAEGLATLQKRAANPDGDPHDVLARLAEDAGRVLATVMVDAMSNGADDE